MEVVYIDTCNVMLAKDMFIKSAIKAGMQYVEMESEVLIEYNYLFRFAEKEDFHFIDPNLIDILSKKLSSKQLYFAIDESAISFDKKDDFPKINKIDYKINSRKVNNIIKTKQYIKGYNRRRY